MFLSFMRRSLLVLLLLSSSLSFAGICPDLSVIRNYASSINAADIDNATQLYYAYGNKKVFVNWTEWSISVNQITARTSSEATKIAKKQVANVAYLKYFEDGSLTVACYYGPGNVRVVGWS